MNAQMFLENFGPIANAPGGVKRLREMIHHLALTGRLSIQKSSEDALELFSILESEKEEVAKITGATQSLYSMKQSPIFLLPSNWIWTYLGSLSENIHYGVTAKAIKRKDGVRFLRITDIQNDRVDWASVPSCDIEEKQLNSSQLHNGDVLIARTGGTIGKTYLVENLSKQAVFASYLIRFIPLKHTNPKYIKLFTNSPLYWEQLRKVSLGTGQPNVNATALKVLHIPLPPAEEQKRIVAKVDELMALCDKLEAQQQERERRFPVLSRACHARFVESPTLANLKAIFDEVGAVSTEEMRNTVLSLAVKGNLVQQYSTDEPAEQWLLHFQKRNIDKSTYNQTASYTVIGETELLPDGWITTQLDQIFIVSGGIQKTPQRTPRDNAFPYLGVANVYRNRLDLKNVKKFELEDGELERYRLEAGDLLVIEGNGSIDQVGRCAQWNGQIENCVHQNHIIRCRPIDPEICSFILLFLNSPMGMEIMKELAITSSGLYSLSVGKIRKIQLRIPPIREQRRIVAKVDQLMALIDKLEKQQARKAKIAEAFAQAAVSAITGTKIKEPEKMKAPKTELVSRLQTRNKPNAADPAPLTKLLTEHNGELPAKALWQRSGLEIDAFYQQLRTEMANGWIIEPEKAVMKEIEAN